MSSVHPIHDTSPSHYQVGGSLRINAPSYITRQADHDLYAALRSGEFCYVFNARQMGKSSLRVRAKNHFQQAGFSCAAVDLTNIGSETVTPQQWYRGIAAELWRGFNLLARVNFKSWWQEQTGLSPVQQFSRFIEEILLQEVPGEKLLIFIDEIDSVLSLDFALDDFFALIRYCYNQRAENPLYERLTFGLFGVATPSELICDRSRTPFNIGKAIELMGFQANEVAPLSNGIAKVTADPDAVLAEILDWTGGQPFLTQKLCRLVLETACQSSDWSVAQIVQKQIIQNWQSQDEPEHLKTIRDRLMGNEQEASALLGLYQQVVQHGNILANETSEQDQLLLSGLVVKDQGRLRIRNAIYQAIFDRPWLEQQLSALRPYSEAWNGWLKSDYQDPSRLLQGQALRDAQTWAQGKSLSQLDYRFLNASEELDRHEVQQALEAARTQEVEARLAEQTQRLQQEQRNVRLQRLLLLVVSVAFLLSAGLGTVAFLQFRRATQREVEAIVVSSNSFFKLHKRLEALIQALKAKRRSEILGGISPEATEQVNTALLQSVFGSTEYGRLSGEFTSAFSPDGRLIITSKDRAVKLWRSSGELITSLPGHRAAVWSLAFSPEGQIFASASEDKTAKIWHIDGRLLHTLTGHNSILRSVTFSPDGTHLATGSDDGTVKIWTSDGLLVTTLTAHKKAVWGIAFSPDGQVIASASDDQSIQLWAVATGQAVPLKTLSGHGDAVRSVAFHPEGHVLASASSDGTLKLWQQDPKGQFQSQAERTLERHSAPVSKVAFSPNGQTLASGSWDKTVRLWSLEGDLLQTLEGHTQRVWDVQFSPTGQQLATAGGGENLIRLWHLQHPASLVLNDHQAVVLQAVSSPNGQYLASGSDDKMVKLWRYSGELITTLEGHQAGVLGVAFSPDSRRLASASWDGAVKLWRIDPDSGQYDVYKDLESECGPVWKVAFNASGERLASVCGTGEVKIWTTEGELIQTLLGHKGGVRSLAFHPKQDIVASAGLDSTLKLWRPDGTLITSIEHFYNGVSATVFSPDGHTVAAAGFDETITLWDLEGNLQQTLTGHDAEVRSVAFSPDGKLLASASADHTIKIWTPNGINLATLQGHENAVWSIAFSPDGQWLISASEDSTVKLWNVNLVIDMEQAFRQGCQWVRDYLRHGPGVNDRRLCS